MLNFWRLTPWVHYTKVEIGGVEVYAFWFSLLLAFLFTLVALLVLHFYLRSKLGGNVEEAFERPP